MATVGELFIQLGIKGTDVVGKGIEGAKNGMEGLASAAGEASLAILGVVAGLEETFRRTGAQAHDMMALGDATGITVEKLGGLRNAFRQFGGENELASTLQAIQKVQTDISRNKGVSGEQGQFFTQTHADMKRFKEDSVYALELGRQLVQSMPKNTASEIGKIQQLLASVGMSGNNTYSMLLRAKKDFTNLKPGDVIGTGETRSLNASYIGIKNVLDKIEKFAAHKSAIFGPDFVKNLTMVTENILKLVSALSDVGEKLKIFETIGNVFKGFGELAGDTATILEAALGNKKAQKELKEKFDNPKIKQFYLEQKAKDIDRFRENIAPAPRTLPSAPLGTTHHASNTTINIHGVDGAEDAVSELNRAVNRAVVTIPRGQIA